MSLYFSKYVKSVNVKMKKFGSTTPPRQNQNKTYVKEFSFTTKIETTKRRSIQR